MGATGQRLVNWLVALAVALYLGGAVVYRAATQLGFAMPGLAPLYHSLPGGLVGGVLYAAWTGLRGRRQTIGALGLSAAAGVIAARLLEAPLMSYLGSLGPPGADPAFGRTAWEMVCDLSAVTILFALFM